MGGVKYCWWEPRFAAVVLSLGDGNVRRSLRPVFERPFPLSFD